jgi:hypothetical protein
MFRESRKLHVGAHNVTDEWGSAGHPNDHESASRRVL